MTTPTPSRRDRRNRGPREPWWTLGRRQWAYGVAIASAAAATTFGYLTENQGAALLVLAAAVLGIGGLALKHPTK